METSYLSLIPGFPLLGAIVLGLLNRRASRVVAGSIASLMVGLSALLSFLALANLARSEHGGGEHGAITLTTTLFEWIKVGRLDVNVGFAVDPLAAVMMCVITGVGFLIHVYSIGYMDDEADANSVWRFFAYLNLFVFSMLMLVMGDNFLLMFVGWEGVGLCSYLLIGFWYTNSDFATAGRKAFVTNRVGDFSFLIGLFWLFWVLGDDATLNFAELQRVIVENPNILGGVGGLAATGIALLFFGGATGKSAQIPLFVWLPDAMAGPTPVSALIHAATMVTSGIYMLCRLNFLYVLAPGAMAVIATVGAATAFLAATIAITQNDIKKGLAYSTVSQLGYMFLGVGVGGFAAGFFHVLTHAFFKAALFLGSGSIIHALHHEQDMRKMGGLKKYMPITFGVFVAAWLAIIGFPGTSGFFSKDEILWLTFSTELFNDLPMGHALTGVLYVVGLVTALLTAFYMSRLMFMTFWGSYRGGHDDHGHGHDDHGHGHGHGHAPHESPAVIVSPLVVLAALSLLGGALNLPHWIAEHGWLHHFLSPVFAAGESGVRFAEDGAMELPLMGLTVTGALASVGLAYYLYVLHPEKPAEIAARMPKLYSGSLNKWFVDEIYAATILKPIVLLSKQVLWSIVDVVIIDGVVNGAAKAANGLSSWNGRSVQVGQVQAYALALAMGAAVLVFAYAAMGA